MIFPYFSPENLPRNRGFTGPWPPQRPSHDVRRLHLRPGGLPQHQAALLHLRQLRNAALVGPGHHQALVDPCAQGHQEPQDTDVPSGEGDKGQEGDGIEDLGLIGWTSWTS